MNEGREKEEMISSTRELVERAFRLYRTNRAYCYFKGRNLFEKTFEDLYIDTKKVEEFLREKDLLGKHIGIMGRTSYEWISLFYGVINSGSTAVLFANEMSPSEVVQKLQFADVACFVSDPDNQTEIEVAMEKEIQCYSFEEVFAEREWKKKENECTIIPNACSVMVFTSGTTMNAKAVMLSNENILQNAMSANSEFGFTQEDSSLSLLPVSHMFEITANIICSVYYGATLYINQSIKYFRKNLSAFRPTVLIVVPQILDALHKAIYRTAKKEHKLLLLKGMIGVSQALYRIGIDIRKVILEKIFPEITQVRIMICGGAYIDPEKLLFFNKLGIQVFQGYGITECSPIVALNTPSENHYQSVGKPISCCKVKIKDREILVSGANVMLGYYKAEELTKKAFDGEWFKTGDEGYFDDQGYLHLTGRKDNLLVLNDGENVCPDHIEAMLNDIEGVKESFVSEKDGMLAAALFPDSDYFGTKEKAQIEEELNRKIIKMNRSQPRHMQIANISISEQEFSKTVTRKIKRYRG